MLDERHQKTNLHLYDTDEIQRTDRGRKVYYLGILKRCFVLTNQIVTCFRKDGST